MKKVLMLLSLAIVLANSCLQVNAQDSDATKTDEDKSVYNLALVELSPEFPGGMEALFKWIAENINYPVEAAEKGVEGRVIVEFVVTKTGDIKNVKVLRPRHPALDKEAVRVVKAMPKWSPGRMNGKVVNVHFTLPVPFKLPQKQETTK